MQTGAVAVGACCCVAHKAGQCRPTCLPTASSSRPLLSPQVVRCWNPSNAQTYLEIARTLLAANANAFAANFKGQSPRRMALDEGIVELQTVFGDAGGGGCTSLTACRYQEGCLGVLPTTTDWCTGAAKQGRSHALPAQHPCSLELPRVVDNVRIPSLCSA